MGHSVLQIAGFGVRVGSALLRRPHLLVTAARQARTMTPRRWWATAPYLPVPPSDYMRFRQVTATGNGDELPAVADVITWLEWCRSLRGLPREP